MQLGNGCREVLIMSSEEILKALRCWLEQTKQDEWELLEHWRRVGDKEREARYLQSWDAYTSTLWYLENLEKGGKHE